MFPIKKNEKLNTFPEFQILKFKIKKNNNPRSLLFVPFVRSSGLPKIKKGTLITFPEFLKVKVKKRTYLARSWSFGSSVRPGFLKIKKGTLITFPESK